MNNLVSIIIPVYNTEDYLEKCLNSIINQDYKNIEIIIINDGSTDNSASIIENFDYKNKRHIIINEDNQGLSYARNVGLDVSNGRYVCFVDSDDYVKNDFISKMYYAIEKYKVPIVCCGKWRIKEQVKILDKNEILYYYLRKNKYYIDPVWNRLYEISLFKDLRFINGVLFEDAFISYKLLEKIDNIGYINYDGYFVTKRIGSITRSEYGDKHYDSCIACKEIHNHYKGTVYEKFALNKRVGALLIYILKTNKNRCSNNKNAYTELRLLTEKNLIFNFNIKFWPFILLNKLKLLKYICIK